MSETTLLRCGFCGGSNVYPWNDGSAEWATHKVVCPDCCAEGPEAKDESEAIALWNRRAPDPRIAAAEEMAKRLEDLIEVIGLDRDTRSAQYALAAWNALK